MQIHFKPAAHHQGSRIDTTIKASHPAGAIYTIICYITHYGLNMNFSVFIEFNNRKSPTCCKASNYKLLTVNHGFESCRVNYKYSINNEDTIFILRCLFQHLHNGSIIQQASYMFRPLSTIVREDDVRFDVQRTVQRDIFLLKKANEMHYFSTLF
jgi:hypothetical protein